MKNELKGVAESDYWVYGLKESDFNYIFKLVKGFIDCRQRELQAEVQRIEKDCPDPGISGEIISDIGHYAWVDAQYLWEFCLWRFQGILEGIILHVLLPHKPSKPLVGLKSKLDVLRTVGYSLSQDEYDELCHWASLRNALSHAPPEQYRPSPLREDDVLEYKSFIESLVLRWKTEMKDKSKLA